MTDTYFENLVWNGIEVLENYGADRFSEKYFWVVPGVIVRYIMMHTQNLMHDEYIDLLFILNDTDINIAYKGGIQ